MGSKVAGAEGSRVGSRVAGAGAGGGAGGGTGGMGRRGFGQDTMQPPSVESLVSRS